MNNGVWGRNEQYFQTAKHYPVGATFVALSVELFFPVASSPLAEFFPFPFGLPIIPFLLFLPGDLGCWFPRGVTTAGGNCRGGLELAGIALGGHF